MNEEHYTVSMKDTAFNWILIVLIGSLLLPVFSAELSGMVRTVSDFFGLFLLVFIISGSGGIPFWMLLMLLVYQMNQRNWSYRTFLLAFHAGYVAVSVLYFFLVWLLLEELFTYFMLPVVGVYTVCGFVVWNVFFFLNRRKLQKPIADE